MRRSSPIISRSTWSLGSESRRRDQAKTPVGNFRQSPGDPAGSAPPATELAHHAAGGCDAADTAIGNLDDNGYWSRRFEEIATYHHTFEDIEKALEEIQSLEPASGATRRSRPSGSALMLRWRAAAEGGVGVQIAHKHVKLLELKQFKSFSGRSPSAGTHELLSMRSSRCNPKPACVIRRRQRPAGGARCLHHQG